MIFKSYNGITRPVRLCDKTRKFAYDSLNHKFGLETEKTPSVSLDHIKDFLDMSDTQKYDLAIEKIAAEAPIRICEGEKISGSATLGCAISHFVPATYLSQPIFVSVSHLTVDFETVLKYGVNYIEKTAKAAFDKNKGTDREEFSKSCLNCLQAFKNWHSRYLIALKNYGYKNNYDNLQKVPMNPATNFYEAVQSLWFTFAFIRLCGNWPGIGRIDLLLGDYLKRDLQSGKLTIAQAREILAHFFIKGCEWIRGEECGSGDGQHYQNILIGGIDQNGKEITNEVSYLVLDIIEELGIGDFPVSVRVNSKTEEKFLLRIAEVMRLGGGIIAVYDEETVLKALTDYGYLQTEASTFSNDGCWEVQIPGKTFFTYTPFDSLSVLQYKTLRGYQKKLAFTDFEQIYLQYIADLKLRIEEIILDFIKISSLYDEIRKDWRWEKRVPCTVVSLFEQGCLEKGLSYLEGGPIYNVVSPHIGGIADTVNSLYAIKKIVFEEKRLSLNEYIKILSKNWEGQEPLRRYILTHYMYYGNDNDEVDFLAKRLLNDFAAICESEKGRCGYRFPAGVSTFGRQLEWSKSRLASPHGRKKGEVLAANASPTPGTDREGATAIICSYCKADLSRMTTGAALDLRLLPSCVEGKEGLQALVGIIKGFVAEGGFFMQVDVLNSKILKEAQIHPENYPTLSVRVSGWNARFVTLDKQWQDMIILQNEK